MIHRDFVVQRLAMMGGYLEQLEKLSSLPREQFLSDKVLCAAAESYLRRSLEAMFDIGRHILAKTGGTELAAEYKAIARGLAQKRDRHAPSLGFKLTAMAGYRNRLVHLDHDVSDEELYAILAEDLGDLKEFIRHIKQFLQSLPS